MCVGWWCWLYRPIHCRPAQCSLALSSYFNSCFPLCLCTAGKPLPYMTYDMKLALDPEPHSGRPGSPYRLSPRELSKASPQPDPNAPSVSRYSVPPGKSTHLHPSSFPLFLLPPFKTCLVCLLLSLLCLTWRYFFSFLGRTLN